MVPRAQRKGPRAMVVGVLISLLVLLGLWRWVLHGRTAGEQTGLADPVEEPGQKGLPPQREPLTLVGAILLEDFPEGHSPTAPPVLIQPKNELCRVRAWQEGVRLGSVDACIGGGNYELELDGGVVGKVAVEMWASGYLRAVVEIEVEGRGRLELPTVALGRAQILEGQVVNLAREPVAGVVIEARPDPDLDEPIPWRTVSDEKGAFAFDNLPFGPIVLRGHADGHADSVVEAVAPTRDVLMVIETLVDLKGEVIADASLLVGAKARVEGSGVWPPVEVDVAADGSFIFPGLIDGVYGVEVYVPVEDPETLEGPRRERASIPLENIEPTMHVSLALVPAARVLAKVVDPEGNPVPAARVTLSNARIGLLQKIATTDLVGLARPGPVVTGPYWLRADADGYLPALPVPVDVDADKAQSEPHTLVLARPATLAGVVLDEEGKPVAGAEVRLESEELFTLGEVEARADLVRTALRKGEEGMGSLGVTTGPVPPIPTLDEPDLVGGEAWLSALTDEGGNFRFEMLAPGGYKLVARDGAHAESKELAVDLKSGEISDELTLRLRKGAPVTGRVLDANGQPIAEVIIESAGEFFVTDETGSFDLGLRQGRVKLIARAPGMVPKELSAKVKDEAVDLAIELEPADGAVDIRLVDHNGTPVSGVEVVLQSKDGLSPTVIAWSDDAGRVQLEELTPGKSILRLAHSDYVMREAPIEVDHRSASLELQEFTLDAGWTLELVVRAEVSGDRLKGAVVVVDGRGAQSDEDGRVVVAHLDAKRVEVKITLAGWAPASRQVRRPKKAEQRVEVTVELEEVGSLEGTISDDIGNPVEGCTIRALDREGHELATTTSGKEGVFRFDALREGQLRIEALPPRDSEEGFFPVQIDSDVRRRETTSELHLRFERP
jgi:protocatechuate 3,4-dioxygenase beta subunit